MQKRQKHMKTLRERVLRDFVSTALGEKCRHSVRGITLVNRWD